MTINGESFESMQEALQLIHEQNEDGRLVNLFQHGAQNVRGTKTGQVYGCVIRKGEPGHCFGFGSAGGQTMLEAVKAAIAQYERYGETKRQSSTPFKRGQSKSKPKADILADFGLD